MNLVLKFGGKASWHLVGLPGFRISGSGFWEATEVPEQLPLPCRGLGFRVWGLGWRV